MLSFTAPTTNHRGTDNKFRLDRQYVLSSKVNDLSTLVACRGTDNKFRQYVQSSKVNDLPTLVACKT